MSGHATPGGGGDHEGHLQAQLLGKGSSIACLMMCVLLVLLQQYSYNYSSAICHISQSALPHLSHARVDHAAVALTLLLFAHSTSQAAEG